MPCVEQFRQYRIAGLLQLCASKSAAGGVLPDLEQAVIISNAVCSTG